MSAYSNHKVFHHRVHTDTLRDGGHPSPIHVQIVPTNRCNQSCDGCAYRLAGYPTNEDFCAGSEIPWDKLAEVVDDCRTMGVKAIEVTGGGEPTVHPEFLTLCRRILDAGIDLGIVTNGARWSQEHNETLAHAKWVRFSLDAGCRETYAAYRHAPLAMYELVRNNIRTLVAMDRDPDSLIGVGFVVHRDNWREVVTAAESARDDGADNFRISALFQNEGAEYFREFYEGAAALCREAEALATDGFRVFNMFGDRLADLHDAAPDYKTCGYSRLATYLGADCHAYACCVTAYNPAGFIGSFEHQSFRRMWHSDDTKRRLRAIDARKCPRCMFNARNRAIAYACHPHPAHANFI